MKTKNAVLLTTATLITSLPLSKGYTSPLKNQTSVFVTNDWNSGRSLYVGEQTTTTLNLLRNGDYGCFNSLPISNGGIAVIRATASPTRCALPKATASTAWRFS